MGHPVPALARRQASGPDALPGATRRAAGPGTAAHRLAARPATTGTAVAIRFLTRDDALIQGVPRSAPSATSASVVGFVCNFVYIASDMPVLLSPPAYNAKN